MAQGEGPRLFNLHGAKIKIELDQASRLMINSNLYRTERSVKPDHVTISKDGLSAVVLLNEGEDRSEFLMVSRDEGLELKLDSQSMSAGSKQTIDRTLEGRRLTLQVSGQKGTYLLTKDFDTDEESAHSLIAKQEPVEQGGYFLRKQRPARRAAAATT